MGPLQTTGHGHRNLKGKASLQSGEPDRCEEVVEDQTEMVCRFLPDSTLIFVNRAYCRYFGRSREELVGQQFLRFIPEEERIKVVQCLKQLHPDDPVGSLEHLVHVPFSSEPRWHYWTNRAIYDHQLQLVEFQAVGLDVTARKIVEIALRVSEERFRNAFETAGHGMALVSLTGDWLKVNKALCAIVGYSEQELLQTNFQHITHPDDLELDLRHVESLIAGKASSYQMEKRYFHQQGGVVWILLSVSIVRNDKGEGLYFVSQIQDISGRKEAEEQLKAAQSELEQRVQERTLELAGAYEELRDYSLHQVKIREEERRIMAREIHDELGQDLGGLLMGLGWLQTRLPDDRPELREKVAILSTQVESTINAVRRISRNLRPGLLDDLGLLAALEWQVNEFSKNFNIAGEFFHNIDGGEFDFDFSTAFFRICQESLTNVSRHAEAKKVSVTLWQNTRTIQLAICDDGRGISRRQITNPHSFGLRGIRERLVPFDGSLEIFGKKKHGTMITAIVPLERSRKKDDSHPYHR